MSLADDHENVEALSNVSLAFYRLLMQIPLAGLRGIHLEEEPVTATLLPPTSVHLPTASLPATVTTWSDLCRPTSCHFANGFISPFRCSTWHELHNSNRITSAGLLTFLQFMSLRKVRFRPVNHHDCLRHGGRIQRKELLSMIYRRNETDPTRTSSPLTPCNLEMPLRP